MNRLRIFSTLGCHLCEQAEALVNDVAAQFNLTVDVVEIADSEELVELYGIRIPVLELDGNELGWPFDSHTLVSWISHIHN